MWVGEKRLHLIEADSLKLADVVLAFRPKLFDRHKPKALPWREYVAFILRHRLGVVDPVPRSMNVKQLGASIPTIAKDEKRIRRSLSHFPRDTHDEWLVPFPELHWAVGCLRFAMCPKAPD